MKFHYLRNPALPPLSWCLRMQRGVPQIDVEHGSQVETRDEFFCEGAWSDPMFEGAGFPEADLFIGSGGRISNGKLVLATSTNTVDRLQILRLGEQAIVSNSLVFLLTRAKDRPDPRYKNYEWDFSSIINGIIKYAKSIPTQSGNRVELFYHCNVFLDSSLLIATAPKKAAPHFSSFARYHEFLFGQVERLCANARSLARTTRYEPLATISTGYDSPTAAALAAQAAGCAEAATFRSPRPEFGSNDRGTLIGQKLGMQVHEFDRLSYLARHDYPEAEFLACGYGGDDVIFSAFEPLLSRRILFTGFQGDKVWERTSSKKPSADIPRADPAGASMQEFRLRAGFLHLPVPFIGCTRHEEIHAISNSEEMAPWRTNVPDYDRPIPRRILEQASVPRDWFGQSKRAVSVNFPPKGDTHDLPEIMSPDSVEDYLDFSRRIPIYTGVVEEIQVMTANLMFQLSLRIVWRLRRWFGWQVPNDLFIPRKYLRPRTRNFVTFHWGFSKIESRYRTS